MALYTMGDLHLSFTVNKPMDIFGQGWENHAEKIKNNWCLTEDDTIVLVGDTSWGMDVAEAEKDFEFIHSLPGKKIILKGNHDYWWQTQAKMVSVTEKFPSISFLFNNAFEHDSCFICGTRGWILESGAEQDIKVINREAGRLRLSLEAYRKTGSEKEAYVFLHYPPLFASQRNDGIMDVLHEYGIKKVFYGHLHGQDAHRLAKTGIFEDIELELVSSDHLDFVPFKIY